MMWKPSVNAIWLRAASRFEARIIIWLLPPTSSLQPLEQMIANAERVRHRRECRVHGADAREEARARGVEVVHLVRPAGDGRDGHRRVSAETTRARLVGKARDR